MASRRSRSGWPSASPSARSAAAARCSPCRCSSTCSARTCSRRRPRRSSSSPPPRWPAASRTPREGRVCWRHAAIVHGRRVPGDRRGHGARRRGQRPRPLLARLRASSCSLAAAATWRKADAPGRRQRHRRRPLCPPLRMTRDVIAGLRHRAADGLLRGRRRLPDRADARDRARASSMRLRRRHVAGDHHRHLGASASSPTSPPAAADRRRRHDSDDRGLRGRRARRRGVSPGSRSARSDARSRSSSPRSARTW